MCFNGNIANIKHREKQLQQLEATTKTITNEMAGTKDNRNNRLISGNATKRQKDPNFLNRCVKKINQIKIRQEQICGHLK